MTFDNESDIDWVKKDKEFIYKGKMYDVQGIERSNGKIIIKCILDVFDTRLLQQHDFQKSQNKNRLVKPVDDLLSDNIQIYLDSRGSEKVKTVREIFLAVRYLEIDRPPP